MSITHTPNSSTEGGQGRENIPYQDHADLTSPALLLARKIGQVVELQADRDKLQTQLLISEAEKAQLAANLAEVLAENAQLVELANYWQNQAQQN